MERRSANRALLRAGFALLLLGLLTGLAGPLLRDPGTRLAAHLAGVLSGMCLVLLGLAWRHLNLSVPLGRFLERLARAAAVGTWGAPLLAGLLDVATWSPIGYARSGPVATWQAWLCLILGVAAAIAAIATLAVVVYAMRPRPKPPGVA